MNFIYIHTHDSGREMEPYGVGTHNPLVIGYTETHADHIKKGKPPVVSDEKSLELAFEFLESIRYGDKPFFLSFGMRSTHRKFMPTDDACDGFVKMPYPLMDTPENSNIRARKSRQNKNNEADQIFRRRYEDSIREH